MTKKKCPHCESSNLVDISFGEFLGKGVSSFVNPGEFVSLTYRLAKREAVRWSSLFTRRKYSDNAQAKRCNSCQGYAIECPLCKGIFKLSGEYHVAMHITCPKCSGTLFAI